MLVGHLAVALGAKRVEPRLSLGTLTLAALLADFITFPLLILGVERFDTVPGVASNRAVGSIPYSHGLLMDAVWAAIFGGGYFFGGVARAGRSCCSPQFSAIGCWM